MKNNLKNLILKGRVTPVTKVMEDGKLMIVGWRRKKASSKKWGQVLLLDEPIEISVEAQQEIIRNREIKIS